MPEIDDTGTIWIRGRVRPEYGVRVGESYFITGKEDAESIECRVDEKYLWVDLHDADKRHRTARRFALDLPAKAPGALFNGFSNTQHADIRAVTYRDEGVEDFAVEGEVYLSRNVGEMESAKFWQMADWK